MNINKVVNIFMIVSLVIMAAGSPMNVSAQSQVLSPDITAAPSNDWISGEEWPIDSIVTIEIDNPVTPANPDFVTTETATQEGWRDNQLGGSFQYWSEYDFSPGDTITLSDGITTKSLVVSDVQIDLDIDNDTISGTTDPNRNMWVFVHGENGVMKEIQSDLSGNWTADFTGDYDIQPGTDGSLKVFDSDQDMTHADWSIHSYNFTFFTAWNGITSDNWPLGVPIQFTADNPNTPELPDFQDEIYSEPAPWDPNQTWLIYSQEPNDFLFEPGFTITLDNGQVQQALTISSIQITSVDLDNDTVSGSAEPNADIIVNLDDSNAHRYVTADGSGSWMVDFSVAGTGGDGSDVLYDVALGSNTNALVSDNDGDTTYAEWNVPNPYLHVFVDQDRVEARDWPEGNTVTLTIDDPNTPQSPDYSESQVMGPAPWNPNEIAVEFELNGVYNYGIGDVVTVTDGDLSKTLIVSNISVDTVDAENDVISGTSDAFIEIKVNIHEGGAPNRYVTADASGSWSADFSIPWEDQGTFNITTNTNGSAQRYDDDRDASRFDWNVPNPTFQAQPQHERVGGWEWPLGENVTVEIDDPATPQNPDYSDNATVVVAHWDPDQTFFEIDFDGLYDLKIGDLVTVSHGTTVKTLTVAPLVITDVDPDLDTVSGTTNPGAELSVWVHGESNPNVQVTADGLGNWTADFDGLWDITFNTDGAAGQYDEDGDETWVGWDITKPRMEISYEHDWVQIRGFTPGGDVTYTIYDYEGGHALFGPVTGPVDSHGEGWISQQLTHTDLIPGYFVTAVNETTSETVSAVIRDLNLDYIDVIQDRAFGTAEPNTTIELHISEDKHQGFNLTTEVDEYGNWEVDLAAEGYPIDRYRHADARLYDDEGNNIFAQPPRIVAQVGSDNFGVDFYTKNSDVSLTVYDSPGGNILYGPADHHTDGNGNTWVSYWEHGVDLVPGYYITAYDYGLDFTKSLEIEPFTFDGINSADDYVYGTSLVGEWVELHVESLFSNWGLDALTDENENWIRDYGIEDYDITDQMWAYGWAIDDQNNWSEDHTTGLPGIEASIADDWISGFNFSPDREVRIRIYEYQGGNQLADITVQAHGNTQIQVDYQDHSVDLQPDMYLLVEDLETGKFAELTLEYLTFDGVDYGEETAWGQADAGAEVVVRANYFFENYEIEVIADASNSWTADFSSFGVDLTTDWGLRAQIYDLEYDATVADAPQPPEFTASLDMNWVNGNHWTPDSSVEITVYEFYGGPQIGSPVTWNTDNYGYFDADLWNEGFDLQPSYYITVYDNSSGMSKSLILANLSIDYFDPDNEVAGGMAPPDTRISVEFNNDQEGIQFDLFSDENGYWEADFGAHDFDLQPESNGTVRIYDDDGDATQVEVIYRNPIFRINPDLWEVEVWEWPLNVEVTLNIDDPSNGPGVDYTDSQFAFVPEWDPNGTYIRFDFWDAFDVYPGFIVTLSDGSITKEHIVTNHTVTSVDPSSDQITGTADPGSELVAEICEEWGCAIVDVTTDQYGEWTADFSGVYDLVLGTGGAVHQFDEDGDGTGIHWNVPNPTIQVRANTDIVEGQEWPLGATVTVSVDDPETPEEPDHTGYATVGTAPWDPNQTYFELHLREEIDIQPGFLVTGTLGTTTKDHEVTNLEITGFDLDADIVYGIASYAQVDAWVCDDNGCYNVNEIPVVNGEWSADFSTIYDLQAGTWVDSIETEEDGDGTMFGVNIPNPFIRTTVNTDVVAGIGWPDGETVTIHIDDPSTQAEPDYTFYVTVGLAPWNPNQTLFRLDLAGVIDIQPGFVVTATYEATTKDHVVTDLMITDFDLDADIVYGVATPDSKVDLWICNDDVCEYFEGFITDASGNWSVNFQGVFNLEVGTRVVAVETEEDDDGTEYDVTVPSENHPPDNLSVYAPAEPVQAGMPVNVLATFEDPDVGDTHTATWDWGDNTTSDGAVDDYNVSGEHVYDLPGVYVLTLTIVDRDGADATASYEYIVVYDPNGGFVTGGGWFDTPDGKANFGFNAKYHMDAKIPYGNTQFQIKNGFKFKATSYNWLVVSGARAQYQGVGTIDQSGEYGFFITVIDGKISGGEDLFRIKIWELATGDVVYDTQPGDPNAAEPVNEIEGGSIVIHKAK